MRSNGHNAGQVAQGRVEGVKSAERVLDVIELLTREQQGLTFVEITAELAWPKSSSHALLQTMTRRGYLSLDEATRRYTLGLRVWEAGKTYNLNDDMLGRARPSMKHKGNEPDEITHWANRIGPYN